MTLDELCSHLLPPDEHLHFETLLFEDNHLTLMATMTAAKAVCPDCHQPSQRMHSGYPRTPGRSALGHDARRAAVAGAPLLL